MFKYLTSYLNAASQLAEQHQEQTPNFLYGACRWHLYGTVYHPYCSPNTLRINTLTDALKMYSVRYNQYQVSSFPSLHHIMGISDI